LKVLASLLCAAACLLAIPTTALAAEFTVDSTADEPDAGGLNGICLSAGLKCTLRAAIEESNSSTGTKDTIKFSGSIFEGLTGDTIAIVSSLTVTAAVKIDGKFNGAQCNTSAGVKGPCVEVSGPAAGSSLVVENANDVEIEGLAITGATGAGAAAVNVINGSEEFEARADWLGVKLDGSAGANNKGIFIDPESNGATIGGKADAERNVFANNSFEGLDIEGADNADVLGNYFGVKPDGVTAAANAKNIEITDTFAFEANGNEVGTTIEGAALSTVACDGGCNVIAGGGLSTGIDLQGDGGNEEPATGPTRIHGNYVGLAANGTTVVANGTYDVLVQAAEDVTVGGEALGDANYIAGGGFGIYHENGEGFAALGNVIGASPAETVVTPPSGVGVFTYSPSTVDGPLVAENAIVMSGGFGIEAKGGGATIVENFLQGGNAGIFTVGLSPAVGNLIAANTTFGATNGILLEGDENEVLANEVVFSGQAGIKVKQAGPPFPVGTTGNVIGGESENSENLIFGSGGAAIEIVDLEGSQNEVARNRGSQNSGLFIDLRAFEPGTEPSGPNGGVKPPTISVAKQSEASGSAEPGATVRVFRKAKAEAGELKSFLGEAVADGSGSWKVSYPTSIAGGTIVAATQTNLEGGTSELSSATTVADPSTEGGGGSGDAGGKDDKGKAKGEKGKGDSGAGLPETTIAKGPKGKIHSTTAKFKFTSNAKGAKFECRLDRKPFKPCKSPKTYKKLKPGKHVFKVRAVKGKAVDPTPAKRKFKVVK
jgi:CSLREA domain-containing protein